MKRYLIQRYYVELEVYNNLENKISSKRSFWEKYPQINGFIDLLILSWKK
jgi:hypothetical protein